jgi:hypothetical protein
MVPEVVGDTSSITLPLAIAAVTTGASLVPVMVTAMSCATVPPAPSSIAIV